MDENIIAEDVEQQEEAALVEFKKTIAKEMGAVFQKREQAAYYLQHNTSSKKHNPQDSNAPRWKMK